MLRTFKITIEIEINILLFGLTYMLKYISNEDILSSTTPFVASISGLSERTVTRTVVHTATAKVRDANVMVTFSITGCHPTRMPFDLPFCAPEPIEQTSSAPSTSTTEEDTVSSTTPFQIHAAEQDQVQFNITDTNAMLSSMISPKFAFQATPVLGVIRHRSDSPQMPHLPFIDPR